MSVHRCYSYNFRLIVIGLSAGLAAYTAGCGTTLRDFAAEQSLFLADCQSTGDSRFADVVVLDWTGGKSPIYPDAYLNALELSAFNTPDGGTLADDPEAFAEQVRAKVAQIYCEWPKNDVIVVNGEDRDLADTVVHITQEIQPGSGMDIGEGEYDPCNRQNDNAAIIFGERLRQLGNVYTFDEWVSVFANVCAHEIGHTLGYGHISRAEQPEASRSVYVELMLDRHTMAEMRYLQRFIVDQDNCPDTLAAKTQSAATAFVTCGSDDSIPCN